MNNGFKTTTVEVEYKFTHMPPRSHCTECHGFIPAEKDIFGLNYPEVISQIVGMVYDESDGIYTGDLLTLKCEGHEMQLIAFVDTFISRDTWNKIRDDFTGAILDGYEVEHPEVICFPPRR